MAEADQLLLAARELELARLDLPLAPLDVAAFLGRDGEEGDAAREVIEGLGVEEPHRGAQHAGDLGVVAACVRGARLGVGVRVACDAQAVELADQREGRAFAGAPESVRLARRSCASPVRGATPRPSERLPHEPRGLDFLEAHLGARGDALADADDLPGPAIDRLEDAPLQLIPRHGRGHASRFRGPSPVRRKIRRSAGMCPPAERRRPRAPRVFRATPSC